MVGVSRRKVFGFRTTREVGCRVQGYHALCMLNSSTILYEFWNSLTADIVTYKVMYGTVLFDVPLSPKP